MKIFITASKNAYPKVREVKAALERMGHVVTPPNGFDAPEQEEQMQDLNPKEYQRWKANMIRKDGRIVAENDAILVLNLEKHGQPNYIGGATFLEIFKAFDLGKAIYFYHPIPDGVLQDELLGMGPVIINEDLSKIGNVND